MGRELDAHLNGDCGSFPACYFCRIEDEEETDDADAQA